MDFKINEKAIEQKFREAARAKAATTQNDILNSVHKTINCPLCGYQISATKGDNICPMCRSTIRLNNL